MSTSRSLDVVIFPVTAEPNNAAYSGGVGASEDGQNVTVDRGRHDLEWPVQ